MLTYILRRVLLAIPTLFAISVLSFVVMQLPPGDFLTSYAALLAQMGEGVAAEQLELLRQAYGLGEPGDAISSRCRSASTPRPISTRSSTT